MFLVIKTTTDQNTYIGSVSWDLKTRVECKEKLPAEYIFNYYHCWSVNNQQSKLGCQTQTIHGHGQIGAIHEIKLAGNLKVTQIHKEPITVIHRLQIGPKVEPPLASSLAQMNCKICVFLQSLSCIINHSKISGRHQQSSAFVLRIINVLLDSCSCCGGNSVAWQLLWFYMSRGGVAHPLIVVGMSA